VRTPTREKGKKTPTREKNAGRTCRMSRFLYGGISGGEPDRIKGSGAEDLF
jgi:hypothetical protein